MTIGAVAIAVCSALVATAAIAVVSSPLASCRRGCRKFESGQSPSVNAAPVSIVVVTAGYSERMERNIRSILSQDHPLTDLVVVATDGAAQAETISERIGDPRLHTTYLPDSSRYLSRPKLAVTIGVKAAKEEWVIVMGDDCTPQTDGWLSAFAAGLSGDTKVALGYAGFSTGAPWGFCYDSMETALQMGCMARKGRPYKAAGPCVALRKSDFIGRDGFRGNLHVVGGVYDFLANKYAAAGASEVVLAPAARLDREACTRKALRAEAVSYRETRKHLAGNFTYRTGWLLRSAALHLNYLCLLAAIAWSAAAGEWLAAAVPCTLLAATYTAKLFQAHACKKAFRLPIPLWLVPFYEATSILRRAKAATAHTFSGKDTFSTHRL